MYFHFFLCTYVFHQLKSLLLALKTLKELRNRISVIIFFSMGLRRPIFSSYFFFGKLAFRFSAISVCSVFLIRYHLSWLDTEAVTQRCSGLRPTTLFKKRPWYRCIPTSSAKFLGTPFLLNTSSGCFCWYRHFCYLYF